MKRAALYIRVSTASKSRQADTLTYDQNPEVQQKPLLDLIAQRGGELVKVYSDRASGARESRPGLNQLLADARRGQLDVVVVWRFDRFARSVRQLVLALEEFRSQGIDFVSHQEALDTSTPTGKAMFTIIAAMAELERSVIRERVVASLDHARLRGTKSGKPVGRPRTIFRRDQVVELRQKGLSWSRIARELGASATSVRRAFAAGSASSEPCQNPAQEAA
jgi:DNA invertase Pin-like site-specific DNA recombinase